MSPEKMIMMANQIAGFFHTQPRQDTAHSVAEHLRDFWEPRMRQQLIAYVDQGGAGLDPSVIAATTALRTGQAGADDPGQTG